MRKVKVSSKGQIVIPAEWRAKYNIKPGDELYLSEQGGELVLYPAAADPIEAGTGLLRGKDALTHTLLEFKREEKKRETRPWKGGISGE